MRNGGVPRTARQLQRDIGSTRPLASWLVGDDKKKELRREIDAKPLANRSGVHIVSRVFVGFEPAGKRKPPVPRDLHGSLKLVRAFCVC